MRNKTKNIFDIIEGYYLAQFLIFLSKNHFFQDAQRKKKLLASPKHEVIFKILSDKTDLIKKRGPNLYEPNNRFDNYASFDFYIKKFLMAYGNLTINEGFPRIIVNEAIFADAYKRISLTQDWTFLIEILNGLKANTIFDLGCGTSSLGIQFCRKKKHFSIGIEKNRKLASEARKRIKERGIESRCRIIHGDVQDFRTLLSQNEIKNTEVVIAAHYFNELFYPDEKKAILLLTKLKESFPDRHLIIIDYYSILKSSRFQDQKLQHSYVHDLMQVFTGQGLTPANLHLWKRIYKRANCNLVGYYEGSRNGINWFIHILKF